jgi:quercetin dioxygenase-like cupin family protein
MIMPQPNTRNIVVRKPLLTAVLDPNKTASHIEVKEIEFKPSQETGLHFHPCPVVGYIAKGTALFQVEGKAAKTLRGRSFLRARQHEDPSFRQPSATEPMTLIAFYLLGKNEEELIHLLA